MAPQKMLMDAAQDSQAEEELARQRGKGNGKSKRENNMFKANHKMTWLVQKI